MHQRVNRQVRLKSRPSGIPQAEHFEIVEAPVPDPSNGQVLVRNIYLSVDPAMRGWLIKLEQLDSELRAHDQSGGS
jgi:NADPH-dependent curcumin reductase CurA